MKSRNFATSASATAAYAFNPVAKAPPKKFPLKADSKRLVQSALGNGVRLASVDDHYSPISSLSLVVGAGTRQQVGMEQQGIAQWLKCSGFKVNYEIYYITLFILCNSLVYEWTEHYSNYS